MKKVDVCKTDVIRYSKLKKTPIKSDEIECPETRTNQLSCLMKLMFRNSKRLQPSLMKFEISKIKQNRRQD